MKTKERRLDAYRSAKDETKKEININRKIISDQEALLLKLEADIKKQRMCLIMEKTKAVWLLWAKVMMGYV